MRRNVLSVNSVIEERILMFNRLVGIFVLLFMMSSGYSQEHKSSTDGAVQNIKIDVFGPFRGYSQITYEKMLAPRKSYEVTVGFIGLGRNQAFPYSDTVVSSSPNHKSQLGFFIAAGYKFSKLPIFEIGAKGATHVMQGAYAKPILYIGAYDENRIERINEHNYRSARPTTTFAALQIELGKQWIIKNKALIDIYGGFGYCIDNKGYYSTSYWNLSTTSAFNYCNDRIGKSPGISFTFGIKTGLLIK